MRYPLWAFLFVFVLPPFAAHAALSGRAAFIGKPPAIMLSQAEAPLVIFHKF